MLSGMYESMKVINILGEQSSYWDLAIGIFVAYCKLVHVPQISPDAKV